ncbi:MAG: ferredoxin thioredoxin reductase catalytic beta chain [Bacilli bacterium]|nr:ferredoxin thioredoxin reductase catalytic beta chain [Bacilli bacterium]
MKGFRINPDKKYVNIILEGLQKKSGHCPCRLDVNDSTLCPCDEFINSGVCKCKLYIPEEEALKMIEEKKLEQ